MNATELLIIAYYLGLVCLVGGVIITSFLILTKIPEDGIMFKIKKVKHGYTIQKKKHVFVVFGIVVFSKWQNFGHPLGGYTRKVYKDKFYADTALHREINNQLIKNK